LARWRNHFSQFFNLHGVSDVRQTEIHTAGPLVPKPSAFELEMAVENLRRHKSPGWKRVVKYDRTKKEVIDVKYITPRQEELKYIRAVEGYLYHDEDLTVDNFTFEKVKLGVNDPEKEVITFGKKGRLRRRQQNDRNSSIIRITVTEAAEEAAVAAKQAVAEARKAVSEAQAFAASTSTQAAESTTKKAAELAGLTADAATVAVEAAKVTEAVANNLEAAMKAEETASAQRETAARETLAADVDGVTDGTSKLTLHENLGPSRLQRDIGEGSSVTERTVAKAKEATDEVKLLLSCAQSTAAAARTTLRLAEATGSNATIKAAEKSEAAAKWVEERAKKVVTASKERSRNTSRTGWAAAKLEATEVSVLM